MTYAHTTTSSGLAEYLTATAESGTYLSLTWIRGTLADLETDDVRTFGRDLRLLALEPETTPAQLVETWQRRGWKEAAA